MVVDDKLIAKLEKLSMLKLNKDEKDIIKKDLEEIISFVDNLKEVDVSKMEASFSTVDYGTPVREDFPDCNKDIVEGIYKNA